MYHLTSHTLLFLMFIVTINSQAQKNLLITDKQRPNEPSIVIHPKNPAIQIAATNVNKLFRSVDYGKTWKKIDIKSSFGIAGDPVLISDQNGTFYFFHLAHPKKGSWLDRIVCQTSSDGGITWTDGSYYGLNSSKHQDKQWAVINPINNEIYSTWTQFDKYGSEDKNDKSNILFTKSTDNGKTWSTPLQINETSGDCTDNDNTVEGAIPAVGPRGEIYTAWSGPKGLVFDRSLDGGKTWLKEDIVIDSIYGGWNIDIPGIMRCNGFPITQCDNSKSDYRGTVYVNWSDQKNGSNDTDIWLVKSSDQGKTWSERIRVNDDETKTHQFFTWMTVDQNTGFIYFIYYDRRHYEDENTDVYMAISKDGGQTFSNKKISEHPFKPHSSIFFGDYTNISIEQEYIRPVWTRLHEGQLSVWTADITTQFFE